MPSDEIIDLNTNFYRPNIEELENLDIGLSIQSKDLTVIYENARMRELTGGFSFRKCFERWEHLQGYDGKPCRECTIAVSIADGKEYSVLTEKITPEGHKLLLEVNHIPLLNRDGTMEVLIETYKDVTNEERYLTPSEPANNKFSLGFVKFGNMGGEYVVGDNQIELDIDEVEVFYSRMGIFWFTAIGQGHQWISNLFGPLPVLDYYDYVSMAYSFKLKDETLTDTRAKGVDLVLLIFVVHRDLVSRYEKRDSIVKSIEKIIKKVGSIKYLSTAVLNDIRKEIEKLIS